MNKKLIRLGKRMLIIVLLGVMTGKIIIYLKLPVYCRHTETSARMPISTKLEQRILNSKLRKNNEKDKYALLMSAGTPPVHGDIPIMHNLLLEQGFPKENIFILDYDGHQDDKEYPIDGAATIKNIQDAIHHLKSVLDENDVFLMYVTAHGNLDDNDNESFYFYLPTGEHSKKKYRRTYLKGYFLRSFLTDLGYYEVSERCWERAIPLNADYSVFIFDACFSGQMIELFSDKEFVEEHSFGKKLVLISSCGGNTGSIGFGNTGIFTYAFVQAYSNSWISDLNKDGKVSLGEAYAYSRLMVISCSLLMHRIQIPEFKSLMDNALELGL